MALKAIYDTIDEVPEQYRDLYSERGGKFELTGIEGVRTQADVDRVQQALTRERGDHKTAKDALAAYKALGTPDELQATLDRVPELEASVGKPDEDKINTIVEARLRQKLAPVERERDKLKGDVATLTGQVQELGGTITKGKVQQAITAAASTAKVVGTALEDVVAIGGSIFEVAEDGRVVTRDGVGVTPGLEPAAWLADMKEKRPHWWPASVGGGLAGGKDGGGGAKNPWSREGWNLTEQGQYIRANGAAKAEQMARAAGSRVGATAPAPKAA